MWMVFKSWDGYEADVKEFDTLKEAEEYFEQEKGYTSAQMYLAKIEKVFNV